MGKMAGMASQLFYRCESCGKQINLTTLNKRKGRCTCGHVTKWLIPTRRQMPPVLLDR